MYPDPITPRAHPDLLSRVDYDPFKVMPGELPAAPRVFATAARLARARQRIASGSLVDCYCFEQLIASCQLDQPLPPLPTESGPPDWRGPLLPWLQTAVRNAVAWHLTDDVRHRDRALAAMRLAAHATAGVKSWSGHEHHEAIDSARAYDLLAASGLDPADDQSFRVMLNTFAHAMDLSTHRGCNNHNSMQMVGRVSLGVALNDRQQIHNTFYGCEHNGKWRYGLIHTLRHDFLADGMNWEGVPGYHMLVLMMVCECFTVMENVGVDLWKRPWPALMQDDGYDEHRGWGPKGNKSVTSMFDALIYQAFTNGDYSLLHDQVLGNLRGAWVWWRLYNKAYEVFGESRYAWVLRHINGGKRATADGPVPVWFQGNSGELEFIRFEGRDYPDGESPFATDHAFALTGKHVAGCSIFPMHGSALLRNDVSSDKSLGAYFYWGPHAAGHRSPASLHMEIHALGRRATTAPHLFDAGYDDPRHLTWFRATIAYNTVTLDQHSMLPYDFPSESLWECDRWRDTISDGVLESFQPDAQGFKAIRASNDNVYTGAKLDRTVVLAEDYVLDVFCVTADELRLMDWAMHSHGTIAHEPGAEAIDLGQNMGYRHMSDAKMHPQRGGWVHVPFTFDSVASHASLWLDGSPDARVILARDVDPDRRTPIGDRVKPQPRTSVMVRARSKAMLFVSVWSYGVARPEVGRVLGSADGDVTVELTSGGTPHHWHLPMRGDVTRG